MIQTYTDGRDTYLISAGNPRNADGIAKMIPPYEKKAKKLVIAYNNYDNLVQALKDLTDEINLSNLNIKRDFSLINAHACALKILHNVGTV